MPSADPPQSGEDVAPHSPAPPHTPTAAAPATATVEESAVAANRATNVAYDQGYYNAVLAIGQGAITQSRSAAQVVQTAAAAIGTLYAGALGVSFSVSSRQLPFRGILPALFLGLAIAASSVYIAYLGTDTPVAMEPLHTSPPIRMQRRLDNFLRIVSAVVSRRTYWLRVSVVALGMGVLFLPLPFISVGDVTPAISTQALNAAYPWPDPHALPHASATVDQTLFSAEVQEVASERQRALAQPIEKQPWGWVGVAALGALFVFVIPVLRARPTG